MRRTSNTLVAQKACNQQRNNLDDDMQVDGPNQARFLSPSRVSTLFQEDAKVEYHASQRIQNLEDLLKLYCEQNITNLKYYDSECCRFEDTFYVFERQIEEYKSQHKKDQLLLSFRDREIKHLKNNETSLDRDERICMLEEEISILNHKLAHNPELEILQTK